MLGRSMERCDSNALGLFYLRGRPRSNSGQSANRHYFKSLFGSIMMNANYNKAKMDAMKEVDD